MVKKTGRKIIHVDMDCYYAAIEQRDRPELRGKPVAVGGAPQGRGVLTTASYEARKFGVRSAMPTRMALKLCPELVLVPVDFAKYKRESARIREIFFEFTDLVEPLSLDEAFLDVTNSTHCQGSATLMAQQIREKILIKTGLTASAGVGPNKFIAKVASDWKKPNGQTVVLPQDVETFVAQLPVEKIFGVGKVTAEKLHRLGFKTCADLRQATYEELFLNFKSYAQVLFNYCRGIDNRPVEANGERKSLSVEETFSADILPSKVGKSTFDDIYLDFSQRYFRFLAQQDSLGKASRLHKAFVKVKYSDFQQKTKERLIDTFPTIEEFIGLFKILTQEADLPIRLLGIGVRFYTSKQEEDQLSLLNIES